jgi:acyl-CoA synthetase (AMP-forming)/AMP-acid ligase II
MATFYEQLVKHARQIPQREALVDESLSIAFGDLPALVDKYQSCLLAAGLSPGSTVGLRIGLEIPHLLVTLALFKLPAHQVTLAGFETESYRHSLIERLKVSHLLAVEDAMDPLEPHASRFHLRTLGIPCAPSALPRAATIFSTTSGTTKGPRIIAGTEELLGERADRHQGIQSQRVLMTPSVEHNNAKRRRMRCLYVGSTSLFYQKPGGVWADLAGFVTKKEVSILQLSSLNAHNFAYSAKPGLRISHPIYIAGARISWAFRKAMQEKLSKALYVRYGASECGSITVAGPDQHDERETVGKPQAGVTVEITDGQGTLLPAGEIGEIRIKAPGTIASYYDDPAETAERFRDGWFYPGDMGSLNKDNELFIHGRKGDMLIMNSINIYPVEIERVLEAHPEVSAAAAFGVKSRLHGDIPAVALELSSGATVTENALMQYARDKLGIRYPRRIVILDKMPRDPTGKILKNEIMVSVEDKL